MKYLKNIQNLATLMKSSKNWEGPVLVKLNGREGDSNFLLDQVVKKLISKNNYQLSYAKLDAQTSKLIIEELKILINPVLLLIHNENIKAIFSGMIAQGQLETVLQNQNIPTEHKEAS